MHRNIIIYNEVIKIMFEELFAKRLYQLRTNEHISARNMILSIGQSGSYINKIENQKALPSMQSFFYICEFLHITPKEFFDFDNSNPAMTKEIGVYLEKLNDEQLKSVMAILKEIVK